MSKYSEGKVQLKVRGGRDRRAAFAALADGCFLAGVGRGLCA